MLILTELMKRGEAHVTIDLLPPSKHLSAIYSLTHLPSYPFPSIRPSIHLLSHSSTQSPIYLSIQSPSNPSIRPFTFHPPIHSVTDPLFHSHSFINPSTLPSFTHPLIYPPTHLPIYSAICPPTNSFVHPSVHPTSSPPIHPFAHTCHRSIIPTPGF